MRAAAHVVVVTVLSTSACTMVAAPPPEPPPARPAAPAPDVRREDAAPDAPGPVRAFDEVRGLWVVRFTMTSEEAVRDMVQRAADAGINTLIVQTRGRGDAFYRSSLEPPGESIVEARGFDPLELTIREAHRRGMAVHAWVNTHLVWGPAELPRDGTHLVNANPEWLAVPRALARELAPVDPRDPAFVEALVDYARDRPGTVEGVYSSPSDPKVQDRVHAVWMDLATRYDLDGIHFDYIRFPSADFDYSIGALERFRTWLLPRIPEPRFRALDREAATDLFAFVDGEPELWDDFRREQITRLVEWIYRDVKAVRPRLTISAAVVADADVAYGDRFQDWRGWLREGVLDIAVPMAYTTDPERFVALVETAREAAGDRRRVWAGIGAYLNTPERTLDMIDLARLEDAGGVVLFSYDWVVTEGSDQSGSPLLRRIGRARFEGR